MNNMLEYMTGGQCYKCGGKVRYADGGDAPQQAQSPIADMGQMQQEPMRPPSALDASAKQLMKFLLEQLNKGTSERILKKTLIDSGVNREQATQLLEVAKEEFMKLTEQGDYVNEKSQQQAMQEQQQAAMMQQMGMLNNQDPMGMMNQAGPQSGQDQSQMAMAQGADESQMADQEMAAQARYGGPMKRLRRYNAGGNSCPDGYNWDEMTATCRPTAVTANAVTQGSGAMNLGNPAQGAQGTKAGMDAYNQNVVASAQAADARNSAQANFYGSQLANYDAKRVAQKDATQQVIGSVYNAVRNDQMINPQNNIFQSWKNMTAAPQTVNGTVARFGGLARFVNGGMKQYGAGGTEDGCPIGYYKGPDGDCLKIFGSDQAKQEYQTQVVDFYNRAGAPGEGMNKGAMQSYEEFISQNPAQDQMYAEMKSSPAAYQNYVNQYSTTNAGTTGAAPQLSYEDWKKGGNPSGDMPTDPRLLNNPYIVMSDKNKIANIDSNWATRAMAVSNSFGDPRFAPIAGGFGPGLKFLMGAAAAAGGLGLGIAKMTAGDESRVYDDKGNVFFYNNKRDERRALKNGQQPAATTTTGPVQPTTSTVPEGPSGDPKLMYMNSQLNVNQPPNGSVNGDLQSDNAGAPNYNPNVPRTTTAPQDPNAATNPVVAAPSMVSNLSGPINDENKRDGGEWNPFVDNRRKLRITMPVYGGGGALDTETVAYSQQEWANKTGRPFPLNRNDWDAYNTYVSNFNNPSNASAPGTNGAINTTDNTNNALSANPNANMTDTKEYTTQRGDPLGFQVASNTLQGFNYMNDAAAQWAERKSVKDLKNRQKQAGNTMNSTAAVNTQGSYGTWNLNAGPGANQYVADLGHTQDWGTTLSKYGGTKMYRKGGTYMISPQELQAIIQMGGEVEFLD